MRSSSSLKPENRDGWTQDQWAYALRNAGDFTRHKFTLGLSPAVEFFRELKHTGDYYGQPFNPRDWQEAVLRLIYRADLSRRYRTVFMALPRKQGKTEFTAGIALLEESRPIPEREIYSCSGDKEQAALIYKAAASMARQNEHLDSVMQVYDGYKKINYDVMGSFYKAVSSEAYSKHGLRPSVVLFDEVHVLPNRDLYTVMMSAFGATTDPFTILITTAGFDQTSLCWEQWKYARNVRDGIEDDPDFLPIIFEFREGDDWTSEEVWRRIMPGLGDFCKLDFIQKECVKAQKLPAYENDFRRLYLNQWTEQRERWLNVDAWRACAFCLGDLDIEEFRGRGAYAGLDLGLTGDLSAFWVVWPLGDGTVKVAGRCWAPKEGKWRDEHRNKDRYHLWAKMGLLHFTDGNTTDHGVIKRDIVAFNERTPIISLFADRAYATQLLNELYNDAMIPVKGIPQGPVTLNEACVTLEELVLGQKIEHGDNPILNWAVGNCSLKRGTTGLVHPDKSVATERIDPLAALINGLAAWRADDENHGSFSASIIL